jgi:signal transduction histidine kinase
MLVILIGIFTLSKSKTPARIQGLILTVLLLLAEGIQLLVSPVQGDYFPISRLGHLVAFPLLVGILQNFQFDRKVRSEADEEDEEEYLDTEDDFFLTPLPDEDALSAEPEEQTEKEFDEKLFREADGKTTRALPLHIFQNGVALGGATDSQEICRLFTRFTAHALLADLCLLLTPPDDNGQVHLVSGYDLIVQETLEGTSFDLSVIPRYKKLMETGRPIHILDQGSEKMYDFANLLQVDDVGNFLGYPIVDEEKHVIAVLALISPYSKRVWGADEQEYLNEAVKPITQLIRKATSPAKDEKSIQNLTQELELSETGRQKIEEENARLAAEVTTLAAQLEDLPELPKDVQELQQQLKSLESALAVVETEKEELAENLANLQEQNRVLAEAQAALSQQEAELQNQEVKARIDALTYANDELIRKNMILIKTTDKLKEEKQEWQILQEELIKRKEELEKKNQELSERIAAADEEQKTLEEKNKSLEIVEKKAKELNKTYKEATQQIKQLKEENQAITKNLKNLQREHDKALKANISHQDQENKLELDLENALEQTKILENKLHESEGSIQALIAFKSKTNGDAIPNEQSEVIASIAQELRQPMSSISGYTDLLISESVGILGALQKKFLERVKASTDRMHQLLNDLVQITTIDSGNFLFTLQPLELLDIIDLAIEATSAQFREKELSLRVNINPNLPKLHTDKDALQQILLHLLQNAGTATPVEGEVYLKAQLYDKTKEDVILLSVTDSGEGIPKEELPRVFSRLYRADNPLIQGVGDTGVGLSIAKTLTEALGGRIWVESGAENGATYSVLLPITSPAVTQQEG